MQYKVNLTNGADPQARIMLSHAERKLDSIDDCIAYQFGVVVDWSDAPDFTTGVGVRVVRELRPLGVPAYRKLVVQRWTQNREHGCANWRCAEEHGR